MSATAVIRPPDPAFDRGIGVRIGRYTSAQAVRLLAHCFFRDAHNALDLTFGAGNFWKGTRPPGLTIASNNVDRSALTDLHVDLGSRTVKEGKVPLRTAAATTVRA